MLFGERKHSETTEEKSSFSCQLEISLPHGLHDRFLDFPFCRWNYRSISSLLLSGSGIRCSVALSRECAGNLPKNLNTKCSGAEKPQVRRGQPLNIFGSRNMGTLEFPCG